ncbi:MAG: MotA/TolQ/ExbB proton channel family protein [Pirellulaceae bacterium]
MRLRHISRKPAFILGWLILFVVSFTLVTMVSFGTSQSVVAQEEDDVPPDDGGGADIPEDVPDDGGGGADAGGDNEEEGDDEEEGGTTYLSWMFDALGISYMIIFLSLSFTLVALFVMNFLTARQENVCPLALIEDFELHLDGKQYQEAYELARNDDSFLGNVLSAGLEKLQSGYSQAIEAMQEVGEEENMKLEHRLSYMALIGTISPMVGLFGTVHGMINAFKVIASGQGTPKPTELAEGISTALFTTLVGLAIAIPAIAVYNILKNRVATLVLQVGITSEGLMGRFENVGGQGG